MEPAYYIIKINVQNMKVALLMMYMRDMENIIGKMVNII
jgi:hypothetical protein